MAAPSEVVETGRVVPPLIISERLEFALRALGSTGASWLAALPGLLVSLEADWGVTVGDALEGGNAAYVAAAVTSEDRPVVVKVALPAGVEGFAEFRQELEALRLAAGEPYVELICHDEQRQAVLLERLGRPLGALGWPIDEQITAMARLLMGGWRPVTSDRLARGDAKAGWLARAIATDWDELGRPCSELTVEQSLAYAARRQDGFDAGRAVLVHGDAHPYNLLETIGRGRPTTFRLIDPEGLCSEPAHDLGVVVRGWNEELLVGDTTNVAVRRCQQVAVLTGVEPAAIWEWSCIERVSSGLFLLRLGHEQESSAFLAVANRLAGATLPWT
jgi:streptomycin 6-kinase